MAMCECGCEEEATVDARGRQRRFVNKAHAARFRRANETEETRRKRVEAIRLNRATQPQKTGWSHPPERRERMSESAKQRVARDGPAFKGQRHSAETRAKLSAAMSGESNPNWNGGSSTLPYGPEFTRRYKRLIRDRDGHRCRRCGKTREEEGRTLEVHHLDHDKMNNDPTNLVAACHSCNVWASYHRTEPFLVE